MTCTESGAAPGLEPSFADSRFSVLAFLGETLSANVSVQKEI